MLPMGEPGDHDVVEVGQHGCERLSRQRRFRRQLRPHVTRRDRLDDRSFLEAAEILGNPVDECVPVAAELVEIEGVGHSP